MMAVVRQQPQTMVLAAAAAQARLAWLELQQKAAMVALALLHPFRAHL
jgi:hypothetical protein